MEKTKNRIAEVLWEDAWVDCNDYETKDVANLIPVVRRTVGYFVSKNSKCIVLSTDRYDNASDFVNTSMVIPWGCVVEWWIYECIE